MVKPGSHSLRFLLDHVREYMGPDDITAICRSGSIEKCQHRCPGPGEDGSKCYILEGDDDRDTEKIAIEIEGIVFGKGH